VYPLISFRWVAEDAEAAKPAAAPKPTANNVEKKRMADMFKNESGVRHANQSHWARKWLLIPVQQEFVGEDQVFFMQLPSVLPVLASAQAAKERASASAAQVNLPNNGPATVKSTTDAAAAITGDGNILGYKSTLTAVPSGGIGKLLIFKSGKVKLQVGEVLFDVRLPNFFPCLFLTFY